MKIDSSLFGWESSIIGDIMLNEFLNCGGKWIGAPDWRFTSECRICDGSGVGPRIAVTSLLRTASSLSNLIYCEAAVAAAVVVCSS